MFGRTAKSETPADRRSRELVERVQSTPVNELRPPWKLTGEFPVGGLQAVGFEPDSEMLLVASANGQGIYNCVTAAKVFRNHDDSGYDPESLSARRLDQPDALPIRMSGIHGGGLRSGTTDGWRVHVIHTAWPKGCLVVTPPGSSLWEMPGTRYKQDFDVIAHCPEFRVLGFSWTGNTFVWSDEVDVRVYSRL